MNVTGAGRVEKRKSLPLTSLQVSKLAHESVLHEAKLACAVGGPTGDLYIFIEVRDHDLLNATSIIYSVASLYGDRNTWWRY
jgi:DnaJ-class molecular chaperone